MGQDHEYKLLKSIQNKELFTTMESLTFRIENVEFQKLVHCPKRSIQNMQFSEIFKELFYINPMYTMKYYTEIKELFYPKKEIDTNLADIHYSFQKTFWHYTGLTFNLSRLSIWFGKSSKCSKIECRKLSGS